MPCKPYLPLESPADIDVGSLVSSKLPPRQLPFLAIYAYLVVHASDRGWISKEAMGKGGAAIVGALSMGE